MKTNPGLTLNPRRGSAFCGQHWTQTTYKGVGAKLGFPCCYFRMKYTETIHTQCLRKYDREEQWVCVRVFWPDFSEFAGIQCEWQLVKSGRVLVEPESFLRLSCVIFIFSVTGRGSNRLHLRGRTGSHTLVLVVAHIMQTHWWFLTIPRANVKNTTLMQMKAEGPGQVQYCEI
jgi:hypothetical protein